jgi:exodeoxyribonuclease-3
MQQARLKKIMELGFEDLFRKFEQNDGKYTWWDYRGNGFLRNEGMRIDLILGTNEVRNQAVNCKIDLEPRGWNRPSDHAPVILELRANQ